MSKVEQIKNKIKNLQANNGLEKTEQDYFYTTGFIAGLESALKIIEK